MGVHIHIVLRRISLAIVLTIFLTSSLGRQAEHVAQATRSDQFADLRNQIRGQLVEEQIPSLAVAVSRKGKVLWEEAFGWADRENRIPATEHTMYSIGSVSKTVTVTGLMTLIQSRIVDLDQPANQYLGEAKLRAHVGDANNATVRRLVNHSSGLTRYGTVIYADEPYQPLTIDEAIRRYGHLHREPGETYEYSNFGYSVLAHLMERASGRSFEQFMRNEVFLPLGMTHTAVGIAPHLEKFYAISYTRDQIPVPSLSIKPNHPGAGGVYSSVHDMLRFGMFHLGNLQSDQKKILEEKYISAMQSPSVSIPGENGYGLTNNKRGLGWNLTPDRYGYRQIFHTGHDGYATSILTLLPNEDVCVVALMSGGNPVLVVQLADRILATLLPKYAERMKHSANRVSESQTAGQSYQPTVEFLGHWKGNVETYAGVIPIEMWFKESGDIHVQMKGQLRTLLSGVRIENGYLRGSFAGDIGTDDANRRRSYNLHVKLKHRGDTLNGSITAVTLPGRRAGEVLSYWIEIKRLPVQ